MNDQSLDRSIAAVMAHWLGSSLWCWLARDFDVADINICLGNVRNGAGYDEYRHSREDDGEEDLSLHGDRNTNKLRVDGCGCSCAADS